MNLKINQVYHGFKLVEEQTIEEIQGIARLFEHTQSGATLIQIDNEDPNKVFSITFKTPPTDNSGVAHIIEHAVCCASQKYPLKDTFVEMDKGSLNTAMNACTYKDMTMYYCASQNHQDLMNLMTVYMDLVFNPLIYKRPYLFKQEGWQYIVSEEDHSLAYNGIVYNEMKGEYAEPSTIMDHALHQVLFPDTLYQYDSGGIPEDIVKLTYEKFLAFHQTHYRSSNCTLYLYGDNHLLEQLALLNDAYLSGFEREYVNLRIPHQQPLPQPQTLQTSYAIHPSEDASEKTILALSFVVGETINWEERIAFQILEHMLLKSAASPLTEILVGEDGLGKVLEEAGYDTGKKQPTFSFVLSGTESVHAQAFEEKLFKVLETLCTQGIDESLLEASISTITFALQEADTAWEPKGILYCEELLASQLYGGQPFDSLKYKKHLQKLSIAKKQGYFESLIQKYFLNNPHRAFLILTPDAQLGRRCEKQLQKALKAYKKSLSKQDLKKLMAENEALEEIQETPLSSEELNLLPILSLKDIQPNTTPMMYDKFWLGPVQVLFQPLDTNGIIYLHLFFDTSCVPQEDIPYLGILANTLTYLSTKNYHFSELENTINQYTGGLNCSINAYADCEDTDNYQPLFKISTKILVHKQQELMGLLTEIVTQGLFEEKAKLKEILEYIHYEIERSFTSSPEYRVTRRLYTYFSASACYEDLVSGIGYYEFLTQLCDQFDDVATHILGKLKSLYHQIFNTSGMRISFTAQKSEFKKMIHALETFINPLPHQYAPKQTYAFTPTQGNEAYLTASHVQAIAKGFNFRKAGYPFKGSLGVVSNILNSSYLWDKVRLQSGAYGCDLSISSDGNLVICSYCDPGLVDTLEAYSEIGDYLRNLVLDDSELTKYIIGTIGGLDLPLTAEQKSEKVIAYELCGVTPEMLQIERDEILSTTAQEILSWATLFDSLAQDPTVCVIGNHEIITEQNILFKHLITL